MPAPTAHVGGVRTGAVGDLVAHLDLAVVAPSITHDPRARRERHVELAMALADGDSVLLPGGTMAYGAHRRVRDGARVALLTIAGVVRLDVHPRADCFSFTVRNLTGMQAKGPARELPVRPYHREEGPPLNEYEIELTSPDGRDIRIVVRVPPYFGDLESNYSAVALIR